MYWQDGNFCKKGKNWKSENFFRLETIILTIKNRKTC